MSGEQEEQQFHNFYRCYEPSCRHEWSDIYPTQPDDDCPQCGARHCSPYRSEDAVQSGEPSQQRHYLLIVEQDAHPKLSGPYGASEEIFAAALYHRKRDPAMEDGLYWLTVDASGDPCITAFTNLTEGGA